MKKVTGTHLVIGGILLYLLLKGKSHNAPTKTGPKLPVQVYSTGIRPESQKPADALAGDWEINHYHQVI